MPSKQSHAVADKLAEQFGSIADDLLRVGVHPGDITFALSAALAMVFKMYGSGDPAAAKALVCESIDAIWSADDVAQARKRNN